MGFEPGHPTLCNNKILNVKKKHLSKWDRPKRHRPPHRPPHAFPKHLKRGHAGSSNFLKISVKFVESIGLYNSLHNRGNFQVKGCAKSGVFKMRPVFCGNFEYDTRQSDLERVFSRHGKVDRVDMKSGFAFVYMDDERDAEDAIRNLDNTEFGRQRRRLSVEWARGDRVIRHREGAMRSGANLKPTKTLFVINFDPFSTRVRDLERHFEPYGKLLHVRIRRNFAFIQYESQEEATKALECTNMSKVLDRVISVEYAARDDGDRNGRRESPGRRGGYGRRADRSPAYGRSVSPSPIYGRRRGRPSPDYGRAASPVYDRYRGPAYDRNHSPVYDRYRSRSPVRQSRS